MPRAVIVAVPVVVVIAIVVVIVIVVIVVVDAVVPVPRPERRHPDPLRPDGERGGEIVGNGGRPLAGARLTHDGLGGQREPREARARRRDDRVVQPGRRYPEQLRYRRCAQDGIAPVRIAQSLQALPREECHGHALRDGEREQQQHGELPGKTPGHQPHPSSTLPAKRQPPPHTVMMSFGSFGSRSIFLRRRLT